MYIMTALFKRIAIFILSVLLVFQLVPNKTVSATGRSKVGINYDVLRLFLQTKELDITETDIEMYLTEADKNNLYKEAKKSALKWYYLTIALMHEKSKDQINKFGLYKKYWHDNLELSEIDLIEDIRLEFKDISVKDYIDSIVNLDDIDTLINEISIDGDFIPVLSAGDEQYNVEEEKNILLGKIEEIYNDKLSDFVVGMISSNIDTNVEFSLIPLSLDGSEDEEFKIEGKVKRGVINNNETLKFNIDFGSEDQIYDSILEEGINDFLANPDIEEYLLKDYRTFVEHVMFIDNGYLKSSDGSQISRGYERDDERYPGYHSLLGISDDLNTYAWARYSIPGPKYVQTFNLHLNPAVTYYASSIEADIISHIDFDTNGKITSIRKPIVIPEELLKHILNANPEPGIYRFKLVETSVNDDSVLIDEEVRFVDFEVGTKHIFGENEGLVPDIGMYYVSEMDYLSNCNDILLGDFNLSYRPVYEEYIKFFYTIKSNILNKLATVDLKVKKIWDDKDDEDGIRPNIDEFIHKVVLLVDDKESEIEATSIENFGDYYQITFEDLPKYRKEEGKLVEIKYDIKELEVEGYTCVKSGNAEEGFVITNKHKPEDYVDFNVYKTDERDFALYNAVMALYDEKENQLDKWTTDGKDHELSVKPGKYMLVEVEAPLGFGIHEPIEFEVTKDGSIVLEESKDVKLEDNRIIVKDPRNIKGAHQMEFDKVDSDGNLLKGATIRIYDDSGNVFDEWVSDNRTHVCPLQPNTYWFLEVEAPEGYLKIEKFGFEVDEDGYFKLVEEVKQVETTNTNMKIINKLEPRFKTPYDIPKTGIK